MEYHHRTDHICKLDPGCIYDHRSGNRCVCQLQEDLHLNRQHWVTLIALVVVVALQIAFSSLPVAALGGLLVMFIFQAVKPQDIDDQFQGGVKLMGFIAFVTVSISLVIIYLSHDLLTRDSGRS